MALLDEYDQCDPEQAVSCRLTWAVTGNETAADVAEWLIGKPTAIVLLLVGAWLIRWLVHRAIDRMVKSAEEPVSGKVSRFGLGGIQGGKEAPQRPATASRRVQRARTMGSLLKSISTGVICAIVAMMVISQLGYNVAPLLASAGIIGVALGFGAQSLVSDFLSGIFMIFEDQYGVGDWIDVGEANGSVEAVGLRVTRMRDLEGTVWYVRNGEILRVGNMSQNWARTVLDIAVSYNEDLTQVRRVLDEVAQDLWDDEDYRGIVLEQPEIWGVQEVGADGILLRMALKTAPMEQWGVGRELRQRIKARFDFEGIEVPFPEWVMRSGSSANLAAGPHPALQQDPPAE